MRKQRHKKNELKEKNKQYVRKHREKRSEQVVRTYSKEELDNSFNTKISKCRSLKKMKNALPRTQTKRAALIPSYIQIKRASTSPTVATLQKLQILTSNEQKEMCAMGSSIIKDIKVALDYSKGQISDDARKTGSIITSAVNGNEVQKNRIKLKVARNLGLPAKTLAKGRRSRTSVLQTEKSSWTYTSRKTKSDAMSEDEKKTVYEFWLSPSISRPTGKKDIKRVILGPKIYSSHMIHV
ncbi:unnamed protein product [Mytilus coruscus]|uniref:Uncharacterized protein n=1 Tax=Mytilus coruscus TaxID=42192 RepID=A0A6J8DF78_MYTCO|nr:unnamed protein product [Mytilus coruscus]